MKRMGCTHPTNAPACPLKTSMAAAPRAPQWFTAADEIRQPLIEITTDSSDDEVAEVPAGGSCGALAPAAAALAGDASEDDEREKELAVAGV